MLSDRANSVANTPFQPYTGEMVAGLTPTQEAGIGNINAASNLAQPYYQAASGYEQAGATPFSQQALNQYMSPYLNNVVGATMANLNETNAQQQQQLAGNAISKGAFGGDRGNIAQSELTRQQNLATGQTLANVLQGGYGQALGQFNASNAQNLATGQSLGQLGTAAQNSALQGAQAQLAGGAQQQAVRQAQDVANQQQFQASQAYPFQTTQYLGNMLLGIGGQSGGTSLTSSPGPNIGSQVLGTIGTLASIPWGSDERLKENMEPVGKTFDGQNIYKFNYKNDGHTMLGLSAQEVEKHNPSAVHKNGEGMRMVDYEKAVNGAAQRGHFASGGVTDWMGGGVKADGLGRAHFAFDGSVPYSDQPSGGSSKPLTLSDVMRVSEGLLNQKRNVNTNIPKPPDAYKDTEMQDAQKGIMNAMTNKEIRANVANNINSLKSNLGLGTVSPASLLNLEGNLQYSTGMPYASGGVVGRHGYAEDGTVKPDPQATQTSQNGQSLIERMTGQPLSDNARMGLLSASLGMLSSRSPFFGVGVGEGATQGLNTYYNAQANDRAYANKLRELQMTEEERQNARDRLAEDTRYHTGELGLRGGELGINAMTAAQKMYDDLRVQAGILAQGGHIDANGQPITPQGKEMLDRLQQQRQIIANLQSGALKNSGLGVNMPLPSSSVTAKTPPVVDQAKKVLTEPAIIPPVIAPKSSVVTENNPAISAPTVAEPAAVQPPAPSVQQLITPNAGISDLYKALPDYANPEKIYEKGRAALVVGDGASYLKAREEAQKIAKEITDTGKTTVNGEIVTVPGWNEWKKEQDQLPKNLEMFNKYPETLIGLQKAEMNNDLFAKIAENFEPNILSPIAGKTQAFARAIGINPTGQNSEMAANIDRLAKDTNNALFADLKENVGPGQRLLVTEIQGQRGAEPTATTQPEAYRTLVGQKVGTTQWLQDFYRDAGAARKALGDAKFDGQAFTQDWISTHKLTNYVDNATKEVAVKGATPLNDPSRLVPGQMYVIDKDTQGKLLSKPQKARYVGINPQTNKYQWSDVSNLQVVQ
jgi:hypothetical protein